MRATIPYLQLGFERLTTATRRVTDEEVIVAPFGAGTTSIAGLVTHCAGVSEFWLGHVGLGRPSERDRDGGRDETEWGSGHATLLRTICHERWCGAVLERYLFFGDGGKPALRQ